MAAPEFKSTPNLAGSRVNYAHAVKAGPFIFLTGHEAYDFATGSTEAVDGPPGFPLFGLPRYRREGDFILKRMRKILKELGSDLSHGVRLDQYYPTAEPVDPYHLSRRAEFGDYIPPSTSVVMERCFNAATTISTSLIAVMPGEDYKITRFAPAGVTSPNWSGYAPAISCNDFIFVAGQMATDVTEGLHPKARIPDYALWGGSAIRKQTEFLILDKLKPAMETAGSTLENAVKAQVYLAHVEDFPDFIDVWNKYFANIPCALTVVPTKSYGVAGGLIEINLIGLKSGAKRRKQVIETALPSMATYGPCLRVGEFLFPSGLMAVGKDGHVTGSAVSANLTGMAHAGTVQAGAIYDYVETLCAAAGTSAANIVRAQYFVSDVQEFSGISAAWTGRYGTQPHPFVCVQIPTPLPATGAAIIADFWIYIPN